MIKYEREEIKADPLLKTLMDKIKTAHVILPHTQKNLYEARHPDLCATDRHYYELNTVIGTAYFSYDTQNWYKEETNSIGVRIINIIEYDDQLEFETMRLKDFHANPNESIGSGLSLN